MEEVEKVGMRPDAANGKLAAIWLSVLKFGS